MEEIILVAEPRAEKGSKAARRLRAAGRIPANVYGLGEENLAVSLDAKEFAKFFAGGHSFATIRLGDRLEKGVVKEVQYDAFGSQLLHVDFARVRQDQEVEIEIAVETVGTPAGVVKGGVLSFPVQSLKIACLPADAPERYLLPVESLEVGQALRLKDLAPPPKCRFVGDPETVIIGVLHRREEVAAPAPAAEAPAEPEVIGRKKAEEEAEPAGGEKGP